MAASHAPKLLRIRAKPLSDFLFVGCLTSGSAGVVREAKRPARANPKTGERRSLRKIAPELAKIDGVLADTGSYFARDGQPYSAKSVRAMLRHRLPTSLA